MQMVWRQWACKGSGALRHQQMRNEVETARRIRQLLYQTLSIAPCAPTGQSVLASFNPSTTEKITNDDKDTADPYFSLQLKSRMLADETISRRALTLFDSMHVSIRFASPGTGRPIPQPGQASRLALLA